MHLQVYSYLTILSVILSITPQDAFVDLLDVFPLMLLVLSPLH